MSIIKDIFSDKKNIIIISLAFLSVFLLSIILYPVFFGYKCGYMNEWYGSNKIISKDILRSHKNRIDELRQKMKIALSSKIIDKSKIRMIFKEFADERANFNNIIENSMIEKFANMSKKKRDSFADKMFSEKDKPNSRKNNLKSRENRHLKRKTNYKKIKEDNTRHYR